MSNESKTVDTLPVGSHRVVDGDSYASLGEQYKTGKETGFVKAGIIFALNSGKTLVPGDVVKVNANA